MSDFLTWHDHAPIIGAATSAYKAGPGAGTKAALLATIDAALNQPHVVRKPGRIIEGNNYRRAYSAMSQTDMGEALIEAGYALADKPLVDLGIAALDVVLDRWEDGGLCTRTSGGWWFHGITNRASREPGGTLNKHLYAAVNFEQCAGKLAKEGNAASARFEKAAVRGLTQMVRGGFPRLSHYIPRDEAGQRIRRSWLYYSMELDERRGRFLDKDRRDGGYHLLVMSLIARLHTAMPEQVIRSEWSSIMRFLLATYAIKLKEGLYVDSPTVKGGNFLGLQSGREPLKDRHLAVFQAFEAEASPGA